MGGKLETANHRMRLGAQAGVDAKLGQHRPVDRVNEVAAQFIAGKSLFIDDRNRVAASGQAYGRGGAGRTGADNGNVVAIAHQFRTSMRAPMRNGSKVCSVTAPTLAQWKISLHSETV